MMMRNNPTKLSHSSTWTQRPIWCLLSWLLLPALIQNGAGFVVFGSSTTRRATLASADSVAPRTDSDVSEKENDRSRIQVESEIMLPFASDVAFDAFADLRRQPSFSKWLKSVDYIDGSTTNRVGSRSKWTVAFSGLRFSWQAESKQLDRHRGIIEWGSVTGMRNEGKVQFRKGEDGMSTHMRLSMCIQLPKFAARVMGAGSGEKVARLIEQRMLVPTLESFRQLVVRDEEAMAAQAAANNKANNKENNNTFEQRFEMMQDDFYEYRPMMTFHTHPLEKKEEDEEDRLQQLMLDSSRFSPVVPQDS